MQTGNRRKTGKVVLVIVGSLIVLLLFGFFYTIIDSIMGKSAIQNDMALSQGGRIIKISSLPRSVENYVLTFEFDVNGKTYKTKCKNAYDFRRGASLKAHRFPVAFERRDTLNAFVLIKPEDFELFGLPFPDSLQPVNREILK